MEAKNTMPLKGRYLSERKFIHPQDMALIPIRPQMIPMTMVEVYAQACPPAPLRKER